MPITEVAAKRARQLQTQQIPPLHNFRSPVPSPPLPIRRVPYLPRFRSPRHPVYQSARFGIPTAGSLSLQVSCDRSDTGKNATFHTVSRKPNRSDPSLNSILTKAWPPTHGAVSLWAAYWIAAGHDGEALIYLAGLHGDDPAEVHDALPEALRDCGVEMPDPGTGAAVVAFTELARLEVNGLEVELSPGERLQYDRAVLAGRDISAPVEVTYFFGLESPGDRPDATEEALSAMGITHVTVDEEISGDGWWHVAAFPMLQLTPEAIVGAKRLMRRLAAATGIRYHGWQVTLNFGEEQQLARRRPDLAHVTDRLHHLAE